MTTPTVAAREDMMSRRRAAARKASPEVEKSLLDDVPLQGDPKASETDTPRPVTYRPGVLVRPLTEFYSYIGGFVLLVDQPCGTAIVNSAETAAKSLDELARTNPKVRKVLMKMMQVSGWGQVGLAHLPIIMAVMAHHFPNALKYVSQIFLGGMRQETVTE